MVSIVGIFILILLETNYIINIMIISYKILKQSIQRHAELLKQDV